MKLDVTGNCGIHLNNIALETFWYIKGMCSEFAYHFSVSDRNEAFLFKSNAVGSIWSLMNILYSSSCRRNLSVISFCFNINKKYMSHRLCTLVVSLHVITLRASTVVHLVTWSYYIRKILVWTGLLECTGNYERWHNGCVPLHQSCKWWNYMF